MVKDCLNIQNKNERNKFKAHKISKKIMVITLSDNDSNESEEEKMANLC